MKKLALTLLLLAMLICPALADENGFCDPVPETLLEKLDDAPRDYIVFDMPDGGREVYIIEQYGWLSGYKWMNGQWQSTDSGITLDDDRTVWLRRHDAACARPDGQPYADALGFDLYSADGAYKAFHYDGEYFTMCGFADPARYDGAVMIEGAALCYYPAGSTVPEYRLTTESRDQLNGLLLDFDDYPFSPKAGKAAAALLPDAIRDDFPGYTLAFHHIWSSGSAGADFARIGNDGQGPVLRVIQASYSTEKGLERTSALLDIPISARLAAMPAEKLWNNYYTVFREPDALDENRVPIEGKVVSVHPQQEQLVLLTEDAAGTRRISVVYQDGRQRFFQETSQPLPKKTSLDDFHAGEGDIYLDMEAQTWSLYYHKTAGNEWKLTGGRVSNGTESFDYTVNRFGLNIWTEETIRRVGTVRSDDLFNTDFLTYPKTQAGVEALVDSSGWAVVSNPNPEDRLNLRTEASTKADSYGKFYNGTPVRVLKTSGDWCQVQLGENGLTGWMVRKYLAFGDETASVSPAFPGLMLKEDRKEQDISGWADRTRRQERTMDCGDDWHIVGIADDMYILLDYTDGSVMYARADDFWEGNG